MFLKTNDQDTHARHDTRFPISRHRNIYLRIDDGSLRLPSATRLSCRRREKKPQQLDSWINAAATAWSTSLSAGAVIFGA
jgi:hypothetical protein